MTTFRVGRSLRRAVFGTDAARTCLARDHGKLAAAQS